MADYMKGSKLISRTAEMLERITDKMKCRWNVLGSSDKLYAAVTKLPSVVKIAHVMHCTFTWAPLAYYIDNQLIKFS